jgi:predicted PurR-regulated permease PerM
LSNHTVMLKHHNYGLWALVIVTGIISLLLLRTYWQFLAFAILFSVVFHGVYERLAKHMNRNLAAALITVGVLLVLVIPTIYLVVTAIQQAPTAYTGLLEAFDKPQVRSLLGSNVESVRAAALGIGETIRENVVANAGGYINKAAETLLGLFIMFITLFFLLRDGRAIYNYLLHKIPVRKHNTKQFMHTLHSIVNAILVGQLVTAIIQGAILGIVLAILGVPNALLWGLLTVLLSIIPALGPFLIYGPASVYLILDNHVGKGIFLLLFGAIIISQIDNVIRPYIVRRNTEIHQLIVIIGVICGLKLWGLVGFILGPLVLAAFLALFEFSTTGDDSVLEAKGGPEVKPEVRRNSPVGERRKE